MANKRHKSEEIVTKRRQVEVLVGQGMARIDAIREVRITEQIFCRYRKQYGGTGTAQLKELKPRQKENQRVFASSLANIDRHKDTDQGAVRMKNDLWRT